MTIIIVITVFITDIIIFALCFVCKGFVYDKEYTLVLANLGYVHLNPMNTLLSSKSSTISNENEY